MINENCSVKVKAKKDSNTRSFIRFKETIRRVKRITAKIIKIELKGKVKDLNNLHIKESIMQSLIQEQEAYQRINQRKIIILPIQKAGSIE